MMERFGNAAEVEAHYVVDAALRIPGEPAGDVLGNWYVRFAGLRAHIAFGLAARQGFPRAQLDRLVARGDARTRIIVKTISAPPTRRPRCSGTS